MTPAASAVLPPRVSMKVRWGQVIIGGTALSLIAGLVSIVAPHRACPARPWLAYEHGNT